MSRTRPSASGSSSACAGHGLLFALRDDQPAASCFHLLGIEGLFLIALPAQFDRPGDLSLINQLLILINTNFPGLGHRGLHIC